MTEGHSRVISRRYTWSNLRKFVRICSRVRHRRYTWLACLVVVVVVVTFLPLHLHPSPLSLVTTPTEKEIITETDPVQVIIRDIEKRLMATFTKSSNITDNYSGVSEMYLNKSKLEDTFNNSWCGEERFVENRTTLPTATLILSLYNLISEVEVLLLMRQHFEHIQSHIFDDVIITAEEELPRNLKEVIEDVLDPCSFCRLFFFSASIYKHRNEAAKFARNSYLVFVDARVRLTVNWLQSLLMSLQSYENIVVSPQLRLKYADDSGQSEGFSRNEVTWDLGMSRAGAGANLLKDAQASDLHYFNQTIISTEVFGISKQFFTSLGGFDVFPDATGGEHVTFSLKVLSCGGNIVTFTCLHVFLIIPKTLGKSGNKTFNELLEFRSPTFKVSQSNITAYYIAVSKPWLDQVSTRYFSCSLKNKMKVEDFRGSMISGNKQRRRYIGGIRFADVNKYQNNRYNSYGNSLQNFLRRSKCQAHNLQSIITQRQPDMLPPTKFATFYGYIRTTDDMYAFGMRLNNSSTATSETLGISARIPRNPINIPAWGNLILTMNTSLWIGPFSFTNGAFIYKNVWCITVGRQSELTFSRCVKGKANQLFSYQDNVITPLGITSSCICAKQSSEVSSELLMMPSEKDCVKHFKFDVQFTENCLI